ncbi:MAG TPA: NUDIX hydrolase [Caldisericia bacterium]|nr:NUDIX hydrolase [Caldisericia bacterium]HPF49133.1 NUDIX hydrolase [Caldisericia bacterium]HPI83003.1 NUDIX hydrolase [Caldisericia bacterium]HPQ92230.1 NUDIX hydrolase [Caldisericia bacterium]HRV74672.1 NUDIX hydrolase [Caldisericia bacterium]
MRQKSEEVLAKGRIFDFVRSTYGDENGEKTIRRDFIKTHFKASVVLAVTDDEKVVLVRQFRAPTGGDLLETPAGKVDEGESPEMAAIRELQEETGFVANKIDFLGKAFASPGISSEVYHFYLAKELTQSAPNPDPDEDLEIVEVPIARFESMIKEGEIADSKTIAAYGLYRLMK